MVGRRPVTRDPRECHRNTDADPVVGDRPPVLKPTAEPPTKEAAETLFSNLFFSSDRYDLSVVGRMKFNRRLGRKSFEGKRILEGEDIVAALEALGPEPVAPLDPMRLP